MRTTLLAVLAFLVLSGCGASPQPVGGKPGDPTPGAANPETGSRPGSGAGGSR